MAARRRRARRGLDDVPAGAGGRAGDERLRSGGAGEGPGGGDEAEAEGAGHGAREAEAIEVDEVTDEVRARGNEERIGVGGRELDVGGVATVGEVEEEAVGGEEEGVGGGGGEGRDDGGDLEHRGAVVAGDAVVGVHGLQELKQHPRRERRHGCCCCSAPGDCGRWGEEIGIWGAKWGEIWGRSGACGNDVGG